MRHDLLRSPHELTFRDLDLRSIFEIDLYLYDELVPETAVRNWNRNSGSSNFKNEHHNNPKIDGHRISHLRSVL